MSNPVAWRAKPRTTKPNARQKRNGLFLDAHPVCQHCWSAPSEEAHHELPHGHPSRYLWIAMRALCERCHGIRHAPVRISFGRLSARLALGGRSFLGKGSDR